MYEEAQNMSDHKYLIIEKYILHAIAEGNLKAGEQLPTETELSRRFGFSRMTVNKALTHLTEKGIIMRVRGRGSFVRSKTITGSITPDLFGWRCFGSLSNKLLSYELLSPENISGNAACLLDGNVTGIHHFIYLYFDESRPVAATSAYFRFDCLPETAGKAPDEAYSVYQKLVSSDTKLQRCASISAQIPSPEQKQLLQLHHSAVMKICMKVFSQDRGKDCPVEYTEIILSGDVFRYDVTATDN